MRVFWSLFAIVDGFLSAVVVDAVFTFLATRLMHVRTDAPTVPYMVASIVYSMGAAAVGGWVTARVAKHRTDLSPLHHGIALAVVVFLVLAISVPKALGGHGLWYVLALVLLCPLACVLGALRVPFRATPSPQRA